MLGWVALRRSVKQLGRMLNVRKKWIKRRDKRRNMHFFTFITSSEQLEFLIIFLEPCMHAELIKLINLIPTKYMHEGWSKE
jgi:hypothetical protein